MTAAILVLLGAVLLYFALLGATKDLNADDDTTDMNP